MVAASRKVGFGLYPGSASRANRSRRNWSCCPVPVLEHVGAVGEMAEGLQAQLTRVGRPLRITLRLGFYEQEILPALERTRHVAAEGDLGARQFVLRRMIDVDAGDSSACAASKWFTRVCTP